MKNIAEYFRPLFWWMAKPLFLWVRSKSTRDNVASYLQLNPQMPILYVLPKSSWIDLLVLYHFCKENGLPLPERSWRDFLKSSGGSYLLLAKSGLISTRMNNFSQKKFKEIFLRLRESSQSDLQIVPVSIFWGKNPGRDEISFLKLIFNDDENAGAFHKFFIVLAQGQNNLINFGKPLMAKALLQKEQDDIKAARKLHRVLRVHFRNERNTTLGQKMYIKENVVSQIIRSKNVNQSIADESRRKQISLEKATSMAQKYAREIAADQSYAVIRVFEIALGSVWNKMYSGVKLSGLSAVREYANSDYEIVYVPAHRSHLDYLLIDYSVYSSGLPIPHTAAGINLNFWPVGPILRRAAAFYIRRSFSGNRLYAAVFQEYLTFLMNTGFPISFFPEGGRSRTGRLLPFKTGLLSMIAQAAALNPGRKVVMIPVYVGYEKVVEVKTYLKELSGSSKRPESWRQLFKIREVMKSYWGHAYISFGEGLELGPFLDQYKTDTENADPGKKPAWLSSAMDTLALELAMRINKAAIINPTNLISMALLSAPNKALPEEELVTYIRTLVSVGEYFSDMGAQAFELTEPREIIAAAEKLDSVRRFSLLGGDVLYFNELDRVYNTYYRNNILHLFAVPSLILNLCRHDARHSQNDLIKGALSLYSFVKDELFLPWDLDEAPQKIAQAVSFLISKNLLIQGDDGLIQSPKLGSEEFVIHGNMGQILGPILERYVVLAALLVRYLGSEIVVKAEFMANCQKIAQRIAILSGTIFPEEKEKEGFKQQIDLFRRMHFLTISADGETIQILPAVDPLYQNTKHLLAVDTRNSIEKLNIKKNK